MRHRSPSYSPSPSRGRYRTPSYSPSPRRRRYRSPSYSPSPYKGRYRSPSYSPSPKRRHGRSPSYSLSPRKRCYRSSSYSPSSRRVSYYRRRSISSPSDSPRGRYGGQPRKSTTSLLVRNLHPYLRVDDLRAPFREFGPIKDIYLPRDYYTGEPRGFGFVQFFNPAHAADAKYYMDRQIVHGREIAVVFAEESRKTPYEMRSRQRSRYGSYHSRSYDRSVSYSRSRSRSLSQSCSLSPRRPHYSRSVSPYDGRQRGGSYSYSSGSRSSSQRVSLSRSRSPTPENYSHSRQEEPSISFSHSRSYSEASDRGGRFGYVESKHKEQLSSCPPSSSKYLK